MMNPPSTEGESHLPSPWSLTQTIGGSYLTSESDINLLIRGVRLILKIAHSEPLRSQLEFRYGAGDTTVDEDRSNYFWLCDQHPDKVHLLITTEPLQT